jgi:cytochrome c553
MAVELNDLWRRAGWLLPAAFLGLGPAAAAADFNELKEPCAVCHLGDAGKPATEDTPYLGGQPELYALYQLAYFRQGARKHEIMSEQVKGLGDDDLRALAQWVGTLPPPAPSASPRDEARYARGEKLAQAHRCGFCHDAGYAGREHLPRLAGQQETYLLKSLEDFKTGRRVGIQAAMAEVLSDIDEAGMADLAHFLAHYRP